MNALQQTLLQYQPPLPLLLHRIGSLKWVLQEKSLLPQPEQILAEQFPKTGGHSPILATIGEKRVKKLHKVGVLFSGGQAPGGHNVISGLFDALDTLNPSNELWGFLGGPRGLIEGKYERLTREKIAPYRNQGGFELIGSGRTKIESEQQLSSALATAQKLGLGGIVIIGGDDSNTNAAILAEYCAAHESAISVIGVPKTIDGDLKNPYVPISFGFDTACKIYSEMIGNIGSDALSAKKYYHFIKLMGRSASHIALECALKTHPNLTWIAEEVSAQRITLQQIVQKTADLICQRAELGKNYGLILIPEGLIEFIPEVSTLIVELNQLLAESSTPDLSKLTPPSHRCFTSLPEEIQKQLLLQRDAHGNVHVSAIETEKLLISLVSKELKTRSQYRGDFHPVAHFFGYEGRAGIPSQFDSHYCYSLGYTAAALIDEGETAYMCAIPNLNEPLAHWQIAGIPLIQLMRMEIRKGKLKPVIEKFLVDLGGKPFRYFQTEREKWALADSYHSPGPIQFFGDPAFTETIPLILG